MGRIVIVSVLWECPAPWGGRNSSSHNLRLLVVSVEKERTCIKTKYPIAVIPAPVALASHSDLLEIHVPRAPPWTTACWGVAP